MSYSGSRVTRVEGELRCAAFGDPPAVAPALLAAPGSARARLLAAIVLGAQGRYASAATLLGDLAGGPDPVLAGLALATLASHRRQLGGHAAALRLDARALALVEGVPGLGPRRGLGVVPLGTAEPEEDPDGLDACGARADVLLGLAADNLGIGRLGAARRFRAAALSHAAVWRARVRAGWVTAEIELVAGRPEAAVAPAAEALDLATATGARRHEVKSGLVLAAALTATGAVERARELVSTALAAADKYELRSLRWPAGLLAAQLWPTIADQHRFRVDAVLHAVLRQSDPEGRFLARESPWVPL